MTYLDVSSDRITDFGIESMCVALEDPKCNNMSGLAFGTKKIKKINRIVQSLILTPSFITELNLSNCNVGNTGCEIIGNVLFKENKSIIVLKLKFSNIGPQGMIALFNGISDSSLLHNPAVISIMKEEKIITTTRKNSTNNANIPMNKNQQEQDNDDEEEDEYGEKQSEKYTSSTGPCVLQYLDLTGNDFSDIAVPSLCKAIVNSYLETLILRSTSWMKGFGDGLYQIADVLEEYDYDLDDSFESAISLALLDVRGHEIGESLEMRLWRCNEGTCVLTGEH